MHIYKSRNILWPKLNIVVCLQILTIIAIISLSIFAAPSFRSYGWIYVVNPNYIMPVMDQAIRVGLIFVLAIFVGFSGYAFYLSLRIQNHNWIKYFVGILTWVLVIYIFYKNIKYRYFNDFKNHIKSERLEGLQISNKHFIACCLSKSKIDKLFINTVVSYITWIFTVVGLVLMFIPSDNLDSLHANYMFYIFIYFTQLTNILCFVFMSMFLIWHKKILFRQNTFMTYTCVYILIVGLVYWIYILPTGGIVRMDNAFSFTKSFWLHFSTLLIFVIFTINSYFQNRVLPKKNWKTFCLKGSIYPLTYSLFAYTIPFVVHYSVYANATNLNSSMTNIEGETIGSPFWIFSVIFLMIVFWSILCLFRYINYKISKQSKIFMIDYNFS